MGPEGVGPRGVEEDAHGGGEQPGKCGDGAPCGERCDERGGEKGELEEAQLCGHGAIEGRVVVCRCEVGEAGKWVEEPCAEVVDTATEEVELDEARLD